MPTCTIPFEVLLEFLNNTGAAATIQVIRREEGEGNNAGPTLLINRGESVSLVLTAGQPYHYLVRQQQAEARMSAKVWRDTRGWKWSESGIVIFATLNIRHAHDTLYIP
ncbi:hypothetical protein ABKN59_001863 [Abortiporus biennis]